MRSTRRSDGSAAGTRGDGWRRVRGVAVVVVLAALSVAAVRHWPEPPIGPRYVGAGDPTPRSGGTFVFAGGSNIRTFDPHVAYDQLSYMGIRLLFDGLLDYDRDSHLVPSLAVALPEVSNGGRTFRFELRRGVRFHNGRELTADDVVWSMRALLSSESASPGYPFYKAIVGAPDFHAGKRDDIPGIKKLGRYTVEFTLTEPDHTFLNAMALPFAYPVPRENYERWAKVGPDAVGRHPVGTGPFELVRWERGVEAVFKRFDGYWNQPHPGPDEMVFLENLAGPVATARFRNGDLDAIAGMPAVDYLFFKKSRAWKPYLDQYPGVTIWGLAMNCEMAPFDDVHVRRAVAFAINRKALSRALQGRALPTGQLLPPAIPGYDPDLPDRQYYDPERAKEEMALAGHPDGLAAPVTAWIGDSDNSRLIAQLWQQDLREIGIDVALRQVSFATYLEATAKKDTAQMFPSGWNMDFPDASNFLFLFDSHSMHPSHSDNRSFYRNPELDRLLAKARPETDPAARVKLYREANDIVARDAPWAFLYTPLEMEVWQPYVMGYRPHPIWLEDYRDVWLDLPRHRVPQSRYRDEPARAEAP